eukprot:174306-Pelagomonas_calceolata.AAC.1
MVWRVTTLALTSLQNSACCRCAASNCCPGLVSSKFMISSSAHAAGLHGVGGAVSRGSLMWSSVLGCVCCVTHGVSEWKKEKKEWAWLYRE